MATPGVASDGLRGWEAGAGLVGCFRSVLAPVVEPPALGVEKSNSRLMPFASSSCSRCCDGSFRRLQSVVYRLWLISNCSEVPPSQRRWTDLSPVNLDLGGRFAIPLLRIRLLPVQAVAWSCVVARAEVAAQSIVWCLASRAACPFSIISSGWVLY